MQLTVIEKVAIPAISITFAPRTFTAILRMLKRVTVFALAALQKLIARGILALEDYCIAMRRPRMKIGNFFLEVGQLL